ncbi:hypothetical protein [Streptomyces sp. NPDC056492]|uniref:hypothetical protein n=1 Tax=unclassified Streptomyces TaxID=2593676 RepID=UPI0036C05071
MDWQNEWVVFPSTLGEVYLLKLTPNAVAAELKPPAAVAPYVEIYISWNYDNIRVACYMRIIFI